MKLRSEMEIWSRMEVGFGGDLIWERGNKKEGKETEKKTREREVRGGRREFGSDIDVEGSTLLLFYPSI